MLLTLARICKQLFLTLWMLSIIWSQTYLAEPSASCQQCENALQSLLKCWITSLSVVFTSPGMLWASGFLLTDFLIFFQASHMYDTKRIFAGIVTVLLAKWSVSSQSHTRTHLTSATKRPLSTMHYKTSMTHLYIMFFPLLICFVLVTASTSKHKFAQLNLLWMVSLFTCWSTAWQCVYVHASVSDSCSTVSAEILLGF